MMNLKLEGETLGQKHQHYNKLLKETTNDASQEITKIDYNEPDLDNLFKIDIASKQRNVNYILDVLKCEDMLYVSRALKQSVWLITDTEYEGIINPEYLNTHLLRQMTTKAGHKLMLTIRLNLKDEDRVAMFYKYYEEKKELNTALKWLPNCSVSYIEKAVEKHASNIPHNLIKRLCEKSITVLEIYARKTSDYQMRTLLSRTTFLLNNDAEKFISIVNSLQEYSIPKLSPKSTQMIMKIRPDVILDNFEKFARKIHIPTFVKFLKRDEIKEFLMKHFDNNTSMAWFTYETLKHFIYRMPSEVRLDFIKRICIEKVHDNSEVMPYAESDVLCKRLVLCCESKGAPSSNVNIYKWYKFATFSVAFTDLKKLIRVESNPSERNEILAVLITCARKNTQNLHTLLQYYRDNHMNEPMKFKSHFVNIILSLPNSHRLDDKTWTILNDIFYSMEVYSENDKNTQSFLKYIIVYKVVSDTKVPDIIDKKFEFDTLKSFQNKLNDEEKDKVFNYLYQLESTKIQNITINSASDLRSVFNLIINILTLLSDWKKNLLNYSIVLEKIKEIVKIRNDKSWNVDLSSIYNVNKSFRKHMFKESLFLHLTQETCVNALKHGPEILAPCKEMICSNDTIILTRLLSKLRTYWPQTLAKTFEDTFRNQLTDKGKHKISIQGLCVLIPNKQLTNTLIKHEPHEPKINWVEMDDFTLSIQKCFAKYMFLARPHPPLNVVLLYAKGDYLQFVLPSLHSILFNISSEQSIKYILTLLDAPVSVQKHGLRAAFAKLKIDELLPICLNTWKSTKNSSIRANIFKLVFELLCKQQNENKMKEIWNVLDTLIDNLKSDENRIIYVTLSRANKVPLPVRQAYCIKSYKYLKSLPPRTNCEQFSESVIFSTLDIMEFIDVDFIIEVIFDSFDKKFTKEYYNFTNIISACLLSTKSEAIQTQRYEKIFVPLLKKYLSFAKVIENNHFHLKRNFNNVLQQLHNDFENITICKNMIMPIELFTNIHNDLCENFSEEDNYVLVMTWNLVVKYMQLIEKYRVKSDNTPAEDQSETESKDSNTIYCKAASEFGEICMEQLKNEIKTHFSSIYRLFAKSLKQIFDKFRFNHKVQLSTLKAIQEHADIIEGHLLVLKLLPDYLNNNAEKEERNKICAVLGSHSSAEVRMHYQQMLNERYHE